MKQLTLFGDEEARTTRKKPSGGSANPIIFRDYESFVAKFSDTPKTTDDCYTPQDVFDAVVKWVGSRYDLSGKTILRPFYPGGDYINAEYPDAGVVIDNPPFSKFVQIVRFYSERKIPFFLFGNGMTILCACKYCTAVIINCSIEFSNRAKIRVNFATNLLGDLLVTTAPDLEEAIKRCPSQGQKANLPKYRYPDCVVRVSTLHTICGGGVLFSVSRSEGFVTSNPCAQKDAFGYSIVLYSDDKVQAQAQAQVQAQAQARQKVLEARTITLQLKPEVEARRQRGEKHANYEDLT